DLSTGRPGESQDPLPQGGVVERAVATSLRITSAGVNGSWIGARQRSLVQDDEEESRFEKRIRGILRCALLGRRFLQSRDLGRQQRDTLGQLLDREQREILADLMRDPLPRTILI